MNISKLFEPRFIFVLLLAICCSGLFCSVAAAARVAILDIDINSYQLQLAVKRLDLPEGIETCFFTGEDLQNPKTREYVAGSSVVLVNVMVPELVSYLEEQKLLAGPKVYALSRAGDPQELGPKGFIFDDEVMAYYLNRSVANTVNLVRFIVQRHIDSSVTSQPVNLIPEASIHHPESEKLFVELDSYRNWYKQRPGYHPGGAWVGLTLFSNTLKEGQIEAVDALIGKLEGAGFNVLPCFGPVDLVMQRFLKVDKGDAPIDLLLAFSLKFVSSINGDVRQTLLDLNVPVFNVIRPFAETTDQWRASEVGLAPLETAWAVATPELSGAIEPTVLIGKKELRDPETGRRLYVYELIPETVDFLIARLQKWVALQRMDNDNKKVAILYYNHSQGKQNIAAAYMNVFRSLDVILKRMAKDGYRIENSAQLSEEKLQQLVLAGGRNVGSWAPGELDALIASGQVEQVPLREYRQWFEELPEAFKQPVLKQWGGPEESAIMTKGGKLIFPMVKLGNVVLMPEPARGWSDDPLKMYHDTTLYPHHQYIAAYLWLQKKFHADAMVHLGTHATYEWLPGKQAGLHPSDPPEVMLGSIPNIYPYIVDDIGEGIEAKRRGRGVIIDYLTPPMRKADLYNEYAQLHELHHKYEYTKASGSEIAAQYRQQMADLIKTLGIDKDLEIDELDEDAIEKVHLYLHEIDHNSLPYGLHTFGKTDAVEAEEETVTLIMDQNPDAEPGKVLHDLHRSAANELNTFMRALDGEYVEPGEGNDPLRNLAAIPTGRNFYGFSPEKVPSKAAWAIGKKAAEQIIAEKLEKEGKYPDKVGVVLWAMETTRNEGVNEATILYLMGVEPVWDKTERVRGMRVIPGKELGRPRIDVLINPSGLYRDMFPDKLLYLDEAVQKVLLQTDVENLLAKNSRKIKESLIQQGMDAEEAEQQSRFRIFTEEVGSYGNGVEEMVGASGFWESDEEISNVYLNRAQFAVGQGKWAVPVKQAFSENLRHVDVAVHSRSSNVIGIIDTDDFFSYLGGMSLAVKTLRGEAPDTMVTMNRRKDEAMVEDVSKTIGREMRTRYLNPKWIEGMKRENYAGARQMADFAENLWGWQVTVPSSVSADKWQQVYEVYVEDKYDQDLQEFFAKSSPWAYQSLTARVLETVRKGYWQPSEKVKQKLAKEYISNVLKHGVACCDHTCNNPALNQMVVNIASLPGVMSPKLVEQFKVAIEKMAQKPLEEQLEQRRQLQQQLLAGFDKHDLERQAEPQKNRTQKNQGGEEGPEKQAVEGYKMEKIHSKEDATEMSSSGVQWLASFFVLALMTIVTLGIWHHRRSK